MSAQSSPASTDFPYNAWYAVANSSEVGRSPLGVRLLQTGVVLYRKLGGDIVALADRCIHRPYPLSRGTVSGDDLVAAYTGFVYRPDGTVASVPTQTSPPVGAAVRTFPVVEHGGVVWVWPGTPDRAHRRPLIDLPWLDGDGWTSFGQAWETHATGALLQDNFSDITHVAQVDPLLSPPALHGTPPTLVVEVSEQQVRFWRDFPASKLQTWQYEVLGVEHGSECVQHEEGLFASPGLWVDRWDVEGPDGPLQMYFSHAITPIDATTTRHQWVVSRNFGHTEAVTGTLRPLLTAYYRRVQAELEVMQGVIDRDGWVREVNVAADAALIQVRKVMRRLLTEDAHPRR